MEHNYLIGHKEIADMGYYFLNQEHEDKYLESINNEFALRVGDEIIRMIPENERMDILSLPQMEMLDYIKNNVPGVEEKVKEIRRILLKEIKEKRKSILVGEPKL